MHSNEFREHRRRSCERRVVVDLGVSRSRATAVDFSLGGMMLEVERPMACGATVRLEIPDRERHLQGSIWGVIRWAEGDRVGVRFLDGIESPAKDWVGEIVVDQALRNQHPGQNQRSRLPVRFEQGARKGTGIVMKLSRECLEVFSNSDFQPRIPVTLRFSPISGLPPLTLRGRLLESKKLIHRFRILEIDKSKLRLLASSLLSLMSEEPGAKST